MSFVPAAKVLWSLVSNDLEIPQDHSIEFIAHRVAYLNWRQIYSTPKSQALALPESLIQEPFESRLIDVGDAEEFLAKLYDHPDDSGVVQSVTSRIWDADRRPVGHMALMNLHPEGFDGIDELVGAVRGITDNLPGYLLKSGRYFHYYGRALLSEREWLRFIARFLMPCNIISPRYIGHSVNRGFCSLRLTAVPEKPKIPELVRTI